jgi:signal transduction histidine kinase
VALVSDKSAPQYRVERNRPTRLRELADFYPDGILGASREGVVTILNAQAAALLGVDAEDAKALPLTDVLRLLDQDGRTWLDVNRPFDAISITRGVPEQSWLNAFGDEVLTTARLVREEPLGRVVGIAVGLRSGRGRARLDRERSDLVATVAHELRSPLTGVKGFVQALLNRWDKLSDDQRKLMLMTVNADADRLARLIAELLDVARIDTGRLALYPRPSDADVLIGRAVESVQAGTARPIVYRADHELPEVSVDPDKFTQVVTNLIENGVRHGEGTVTVLAEKLGPDDEYPGVRIVVEDEGEGIAPGMRRRVFTKFWKSGARGGSGLGLYLVNGLVRAHGGSVVIGDAPGGGARVELTWPAEDLRPGRSS